jgi:polysaccharide biosynthesis/export protein
MNISSAAFNLLGLRSARLLVILSIAVQVAACGFLPQSGPSTKSIQEQYNTAPNGLQLIDVTPQIARQLASNKQSQGFSSSFGGGLSADSPRVNNALADQLVGVGDILEVSIWEAPPATLFSASDFSARGGASSGGSRNTTLPEQTVGSEGKISVPFIGQILVNGRTGSQIEAEIVQRLKGKANQPQVLVRLLRNNSSLATIVGEVVTNTRMPLTARGERLLDAIATAGGSKQPINKTTVQITRGTVTVAMSLDSVIRDAQHNITLKSGDIITAAFQPLSFTALGATGKNDEVNFEAQGITLAQALARVGGLQDARADAQGIFIFRLEDAKALNWPSSPATTTAEGKVPVIYRLDLKDPASFFAAQAFAIENKDVMYVSNAPAADWQKFANLIYTIALPGISTISTFK